jgi:hypothetical protein
LAFLVVNYRINLMSYKIKFDFEIIKNREIEREREREREREKERGKISWMNNEILNVYYNVLPLNPTHYETES